MTDSTNSMIMPVAPYYGGGNGGMGGFGDMGGWGFILLLIVLCGWGGNFGGFGGGNNAFPWMMAGQANSNNDVQRGFDQAAVISGITGIQNGITSGFGDLQAALCGGFGTVNSNIANGFAQAEIGANARQMAGMQQDFALQTAMLGGFNGLQSQLADCCCQNRTATFQTQAVVQAEGAATRNAIQGGIQTILDRMCADKIDQKNEKIVELNNKINSLESNNYIQNALTAQTQYFLQQYPPTATATKAVA